MSTNRPFKLAIFASGSGSNAEEIFKYFTNHHAIEVVALFSNNPHAYALQRAKNYNVDTFTFDRVGYRENTNLLQTLQSKNVTHIVLAGFLWLIPTYLIEAYPERIVNIHPALLPKYGGKGMYGMHVHEAVKAAGEKESGITIHLVNEVYDDGEILAQEKVALDTTDTPETIAQKIHALEHAHFPKVIESWVLRG
jgi:phosphoribosylglycinamide formyltransferase-1